MDKFEFLTELCARLSALPEEDAKRSVDYYSEMIDDRMEDGLSEEEAVAAIGDIDEIAKTILANTPLSQPQNHEKAPSRRLRWWEILLLVLGFPVWGSIAISLLAAIFSVWVSLWSVVISLYATAVALAASAVGCVIACFFMIGSTPTVLVCLGAALVCAGLSILIFLLSNLAAKGMVELTKLTVTGIKGMFARKERAV